MSLNFVPAHVMSLVVVFVFFTANGCVSYSYVENGCVRSIAVRDASVPVLNHYNTVLWWMPLYMYSVDKVAEYMDFVIFALW